MTEPWQKMKQMIADRLREPSMTAIAGKLDIPRFLDDDLDTIMLISAQELCREVPDHLAHALGAAAHTVITSNTGVAVIGIDVVKLLAVTIDGAPAKRARSLSDYNMRKRASATQAIYVFTSNYPGIGNLVYTDTTLRAVGVIEPPLAVFKDDAPTLPPGYSQLLVERSLERISTITSG